MSAPFRFGLERVREIRAHDEDQAKERFAASLNARLRGEAVLRAAEARLRDAQSGAVTPGLGPLTGASLVSRQASVERLEQSRVDAQLRMASYEAELQARRAELRQASQARRGPRPAQDAPARAAPPRRRARRGRPARRDGAADARAPERGRMSVELIGARVAAILLQEGSA